MSSFIVRVITGSLLCVVHTFGSARAQAVSATVAQQASARVANPLDRKISVDLTDVPLQRAVDEIANLAGVRIVYVKDQLAARGRVSIRNVSVTAGSALNKVLTNTGLAVSSYSGSLAIVERGKSSSVRISAQGVIAGKVTDSKTGKGIAGANVTADGNARSITTGDDGSYRLTGVAAGSRIIAVRLVGYAKQTRVVLLAEGATVTADFKLEPSANVLDQVVVTGTVIATELKAVPNAITVVTAKQIEERGITRIDQLFRGDIPGLFSLNLGSSAQLDQVIMFSRGATALTPTSAGTSRGTNPIKTYIDGVEMADPQYLSQIDPGSIERIEILTGPQASTIYGANALNGVMQIFTKRGSSNRPQLIFDVSSGVTENNFSSSAAPSHLLDAGATGMEGKLSYSVGSSWNYAGSWTPGKQTQRLSYYGGGRIELGKLSTDASARSGVTQNRQNGNLDQGQTARSASGEYDPTGFDGMANPQTQSLNGRTLSVSLSYRPYSWWSHNVVLGTDASVADYVTTAPKFGGATGTDTTLFISSTTTARASQNYNGTMQIPLGNFMSSGARLNLTYGGDHWRTSGSSWFASPLSLTGTMPSPSVTRTKPSWNKGAFVQGQLSMFDAIFFTYGVRADWNPGFGEDAKVKPGRYGLSMTRDIDTPLGPVSAKIRGSYGRSIRPPSADLEHGLPQTSATFIARFGPYDLQLPNPDLGPEHQQGGEGGLELYFASRGSLVITRFNQTVDNLISTVNYVDSVRSLIPVFPRFLCQTGITGIRHIDDEGHCFRYQEQYLNVGGIRNQGWELQGSVNFGPITTRGTYSWVKSRIIGITPRYRHLLAGFEPGRPFDYLPEHTWALGVTYAESRSTVSLSVNGTGMRYLGFDDVLMATDSRNRFQFAIPRLGVPPNYRPLDSGYGTADLNATHSLTSRMDATIQISNLTDYYQNDFGAEYATAGRSSRVGLRFRF